jgi:hypothetical protein
VNDKNRSPDGRVAPLRRLVSTVGDSEISGVQSQSIRTDSFDDVFGYGYVGKVLAQVPQGDIKKPCLFAEIFRPVIRSFLQQQGYFSQCLHQCAPGNSFESGPLRIVPAALVNGNLHGLNRLVSRSQISGLSDETEMLLLSLIAFVADLTAFRPLSVVWLPARKAWRCVMGSDQERVKAPIVDVPPILTPSL